MSEARRLFCPHCEESLALRTYREHVRLFCDTVSHTWTKKRKSGSEEEDPDVVSDQMYL